MHLPWRQLLTAGNRYSGVRRQDFPPLSGGRENRYTPPAKRAPTSQSTVKGAPVDPAIISSQIKAPVKRQSSVSEQARSQASEASKNGSQVLLDSQGTSQTTHSEQKMQDFKSSPAAREMKTPESKPAEKAMEQSAASGPSTAAAPGRGLSAQSKDGTTPSATSTVERDVLNSFKSFATQQRINAEKVRSSKARADKEVKLTELKKFATSFKLSTPVPSDLVSIIAKDPAKQKEIQAKAMKNAEEMAKTKAEVVLRESVPVAKESQAKATDSAPAAANVDSRSARASGPPQTSGPPGGGSRHPGPRQQFHQPPYQPQPYRNSRGGLQHAPPPQQTGTLSQRLRHVEQQRYSQLGPLPQHQPTVPDVRAPPTGPSNSLEPGYGRRLSGAPGHMSAKLNPNSHEFRPSPFAASFNPNGYPSTSSSPRAMTNHVAENTTTGAPAGQLIRRKTKAVDIGKCIILAHIKTLKPPQGRNWDDNRGLRPSYDTLPTWRQLQDDEKTDSTMHLTYKEYFERQPFSNPTMSTPNPPHVVPQLAHQHQLPFHLQHGAHGLGPRQSPHMPPMQMHAPHHGPLPHPTFGNDDHRMMHSNSNQSFASPRMGQMPVTYPAQVPYSQPVFMGPNNPHMGQYRSFSNSPHYAPPQQGQMGGSMMMQPHFIPGPQGIMATPQMIYHGGHPQFMPPSGPPQSVPGANGYPSPGRPTAPVMVHQGSQQGQPMYGLSPGVQYTQPAYGPVQANGPSQ